MFAFFPVLINIFRNKSDVMYQKVYSVVFMPLEDFMDNGTAMK